MTYTETLISTISSGAETAWKTTSLYVAATILSAATVVDVPSEIIHESVATTISSWSSAGQTRYTTEVEVLAKINSSAATQDEIKAISYTQPLFLTPYTEPVVDPYGTHEITERLIKRFNVVFSKQHAISNCIGFYLQDESAVVSVTDGSLTLVTNGTEHTIMTEGLTLDELVHELNSIHLTP